MAHLRRLFKHAPHEVAHVVRLHQHQQGSGFVKVVNKVGDEVAVKGRNQIEQTLVYYVEILSSQQTQQILSLFGKRQCCIFVLEIEEGLNLRLQMLVAELLLRLHVQNVS